MVLTSNSGTIKGHKGFTTQCYSPQVGELVALVEALKMAKPRDTILTDQLHIVDSLLTHGMLVTRKRCEVRDPIVARFNLLLKSSAGVVIQHVKSHGGSTHNYLADNIAKIKSGVRKNALGSPVYEVFGNV